MAPEERDSRRAARREPAAKGPRESAAGGKPGSGLFLDSLLRRFQDMQSGAGWKTVFGDVIEVDGRRLIPVASVQYGFGMGGGQGTPEQGGTPGGGGGGGGMRAEPVALVELSEGQVRISPIINVTRLAIVALVVAGWSVFWMARAMRTVAAARR